MANRARPPDYVIHLHAERLAGVMRTYRARQAQFAKADEDLHDAIKEALQQGFSPSAVATWADLSVMRVVQIQTGRRDWRSGPRF